MDLIGVLDSLKLMPTLSIYDLPLLCLQPWDRAVNPVNIKLRFRCSESVSFDTNIFSKEKFLSHAVTDTCLPESETRTIFADVDGHLSSGKANDHPSSSSRIVYNDHSSDDSFESDEEKSTIDVPRDGYIIANVYGKSLARKHVVIVDRYEVRSLKRNFISNGFCFTNEPLATVPFQDVVAVLPKPIKDSKPRFQDMVYFNVDLSEYTLQQRLSNKLSQKYHLFL
ncbi:hypothetical protein ILUMI_03036 [Ignelater luminosus]|uniref:Uncharacterized protein n=1 Tax=Ignelater luminosus TaxID=2038154 RepID=A0A8K0GKU6_IGNLU|nr:hypothetical protein ILUMI_03036 [Ignelater luminosus]